MINMFWNYVLENKVLSLIFVIVSLVGVFGFITASIMCSIANRRKRRQKEREK